MIKENYFIITGGPGMGKTAIIDELRRSGYTAVTETGRNIIREQVVQGGHALPWADRSEFALLMFRQSVTDFRQHLELTTPVFFDRGIADVIGYLQLCGLPVPEDMVIAARELRANDLVFITPPWEEIFHQDTERKQSFEEAVRTYEMMRQVYISLNYKLVTLPKTTIRERTAFILENQ